MRADERFQSTLIVPRAGPADDTWLSFGADGRIRRGRRTDKASRVRSARRVDGIRGYHALRVYDASRSLHDPGIDLVRDDTTKTDHRHRHGDAADLGTRDRRPGDRRTA